MPLCPVDSLKMPGKKIIIDLKNLINLPLQLYWQHLVLLESTRPVALARRRVRPLSVHAGSLTLWAASGTCLGLILPAVGEFTAKRTSPSEGEEINHSSKPYSSVCEDFPCPSYVLRLFLQQSKKDQHLLWVTRHREWWLWREWLGEMQSPPPYSHTQQK